MKLEVQLINEKASGNESTSFQEHVSILSDKNTIYFKVGHLDVYLEGEFYYYVVDGSAISIENNDINVLKKIFLEYSLNAIPQMLEGTYCCFVQDDSTQVVTLFSDYFNRKNVYYTTVDNCFIASSSLLNVLSGLKKITYDQNSVYSYMLLGYTPLLDTFYEGVKRIGTDELIVVSKNNITQTSYPRVKEIVDYDKSYIEKYELSLVNAVKTRASSIKNTVMLSGGWDSTTLIYLLTENYEKNQINAVVSDVIISNNQSFNSYEVDKSKRIAKHFDIKIEQCIADYNHQEIVDVWERNLAMMRENHVYFWVDHLNLSENLSHHYAQGTSIFNGEASDSIHNFGYSQAVSVNYNNKSLREYADKCKSFLYGPTFLEKIENGQFNDDQVFQFFRNYYGPEKFDLSSSYHRDQLLQKYLQAFTLSYPRVPFAQWKNVNIANETINKQFEEHINAVYLSDCVQSMNPSNMYYYLLQLYRRFHFQSAQINVCNAAFGQFHAYCKMPFLDINLVNYMYSMPESWGRGLELRTTKYPLRYLATEKWVGMPLHILEEKGPHSYISENDEKWNYSGGSWNLECEILYQSAFRDYFKEIFLQVNLEDYFDGDLFNLKYMQQIIDAYLNGVESSADSGMLFRLAVLFSIGLFKSPAEATQAVKREKENDSVAIA